LRLCSLSLLILTAACSADPPAHLRALITNGTDDSGDPAVVAIVTRAGDLRCSATVIGPHTVLTAAHCMLDASDYEAFQVFFGAALASGGAYVDISDAQIDPAYDPIAFANDLGLLTLKQAAPATAVALDPRSIDATLVGQTFSAVGFGVTSPANHDPGTKRSGAARVSAVAASDFTAQPAPSEPCADDSGGPALFTVAGATYVAGVVSHGDAACADHAVYARIDVALAPFIQPYLTATAPGSAGAGERCFYTEQCRGGPCLQTADEPKRSFCSQPCKRAADCPSAMVCAPDGCRYPTPSPGATGWSCAQAAECASGTCLTTAGTSGMCTRRCVAIGQDCPSGFECRPTTGTDFYCLRVPRSGCAMTGAPSPGPGAPCALALLLLFIVRRRAAR
jgi:secreted trypsin-like serine protease